MITNLDKYTFKIKEDQVIPYLQLSTEPFPNGNCLRSTAEILLLAEPELESYYQMGFQNGLWQFKVDYGLYSRYTDKEENTQVDDILALGCHAIHAAAILDYTRHHLGFFDVNFPKVSPKTWLFRYQGLWQHLKMAAGESLGWFGQCIWALSIYLAAKEPIDHQDNWVLSHMQVIVKERRQFKSWICDLAVSYWRSKKTKKTSQIMAEYTGIPDHPLVQAWSKYD